MKIPIVSSADAATLEARYLIETFKNMVTEAPFATLNDTHNVSLRSLADRFNIIQKDAKKSTDVHNGLRGGTPDVSAGTNQFSAPIKYCYPTINANNKHQI